MGRQIVFILSGAYGFTRNLLHYSGSIQAKIFITFSLVVLLSITVISVTTYLNFSRTIEANAAGYVSDAVRHANENFEMIFDDIEKISTVIVTNQQNVISVITSGKDPVEYDGFRENQSTESFLSSLIAYKTYISRIAIIGTNGKIFSAGGSMLFGSILEAPWFQQALISKDKQILIDAPDKESVSFSRIIRQNNRPVGVVVIDLNKAYIQKIFNVNPVEGSLLFVADPMGNFIFKPKTDIPEQSLLESASAPTLDEVNDKRSLSHSIITLSGNKYLAVRYTSSMTGWLTLGLIPYDSLMKEATAIKLNIIRMVSLVFFIVLIVSVAVSNQMTKSLKHLSYTMNKVREGNLRARPRVRSKDEIGDLSEGFNLMMNRIHSLLDEVKNGEKEKREAELIALQAQIRPHFIYNTLGTIKNLARVHNVKNIEDLTVSFIDLLRMTLGHTREFITIEEEMHYLRSYIHVQQYKYLDRVSVRFQVEDEALECLTIRLLLQPIIENAMMHAIGESGKNLLVTVRIYSELDQIKFEVTDNGIGMTSGQIEQALEPSDNDGRFTGIGIRNVNERIQRTFGNEYGLTVLSEQDMYTTVEFSLPIRRRDE
jgi:two-component system sensor histidine kinase YesM